MKTIGIIGGLGPESTKIYYEELINKYKERANGQYPEILIYSVNLLELKKYIEENDLNSLAITLSDKLDSLVKAGADFICIASNTPHIVFDKISQNSKVPMISIVEEAAKYASKISTNKKIGLMGTGFTMKADFFPKSFNKYDLKIFTPDSSDQEFIHEKIFSELANGVVKNSTKEKFLKIAESLIKKYSIDSLVLGCTELPLVFDKEYFGINYLDTVKIHVDSIIKYCFKES